MEHSTRRYDPPESVVGPAFAELLDRLRRARLSKTPDPQLPNEERVLFDYGVAQRRRVLEHAIFLVFGQWIFYRQFIAQSASRAVRLSYAVGSAAASTAFLRHRARKVSLDLFAHIATADSSSALGNEARIVLAELEGPEGPYLRSVIRERGFETAFADALATVQVPTSDTEQVDVHPQLCLKPRLLTDDVPSSTHPFISHPRIDVDSASRPGRYRQKTARVDQHTTEDTHVDHSSEESTLRPRPSIRLRSQHSSGKEAYPDFQLGNRPFKAPFTAGDATNTDDAPYDHTEYKRKSDAFETRSENDQSSSDWKDPFDFSKAAHIPVKSDISDSELNAFSDSDSFDHDDTSNSSVLTPSQRRAAERRKKRLLAKSQTDSDDESLDNGSIKQERG